MAPPTIRQSVTGTSSDSFPAPAQVSVDLPSAAVAGNLLVFCLAGDKNTGTLAVGDNIDPYSGTTNGTGWTTQVQLTSSSVSLYIHWKVADGGESTISGEVSTSTDGGNTFWAAELEQTGSAAWAALAEEESGSNGTTSVSSVAIGPTAPAAAYEGLAIAAAAIDSISSFSGSQSPSWTNSFVSRGVPGSGGAPGSGGGSAGCYTASLAVAASATPSTTFSLTGGSDQMSGAMVVFGRQIPAGADAEEATLSVAGQNATITTEAPNAFPSTATVSVAAQSPAVVTSGAPGGLYDLSLWKITLPTDGGDANSTADEITQPALDTYEDDNFFLDGSGQMTMIAPVQGATTSGSGGTRCELREMWGGVDEADWTPFDTDFHQLTVTMTADPTSCTDRKEMIVAQIHGTTGSPPIYIAKEHHVATPRLRVYKDGPGVGNMLSGIGATDTFTIRFEYLPSTGGPEGGTLNIYAGLGEVADLPGTPSFTYTGDQFTDNTGWYFKTGAYNKSEVANGGTGESITKISFLELIQPGNPDAGNATFTFVANNAAISSATDSEQATLSVAGQDATVLIDEGGTTVMAGVATLSAVAEDATSATAPTSGDPSASIESLDVSAEIVGSAGTGSVGVAAEDAAAQVVVNPSTATLGVAAQDASIPAGAPAEEASAALAALDATITRQQPPVQAAPSVGALQASTLIAAGTDGSALTVAALDATVTTGSTVTAITAGITVELDSPGWSATITPLQALLALAALNPSAVVPDVFGSILSLTRTGPSIVGVSSRPGPAIIAVQREIGEAGGV